MPTANPKRDILLKYIKTQFPYREDFIDWEGKAYSYDMVKEAIYDMRECSTDLLRILNFYMYTHLPRTRIAEELNFDPSTIKRKLDKALDEVMQKLSHKDFGVKDLFTVKDGNTGEVKTVTFPTLSPW